MPLFLGEDKISQVVISVDNADGSINTNDATLTSGGQMLSGVTAYSKGTKYTGTITTVEGPTPDISVSGSGLVTASVSNPKGYQSSATTKTATQQLTTQGAKVITPSDSAQTAVSSGTYVTGDITVDAIPSNYIDTGDANAISSDIIENKTAYINGVKVIGTMSSLGNIMPIFSTSDQPVSVNYFTRDLYIESEALEGNVYIPSGDNVYIMIPSERRKEVLGNANASEVLAGKTFVSDSNIISMTGNTQILGVGTMPSKEAATFTPTTTDQTIDAGQYLAGVQTIQGDANLLPENIISGKSIFGVSGSVVIQKYYTGSTEPSSSLGNDGDLYFKA